MTEDEARTKWCHRTFGTGDQSHCCASECVAWRWGGGAYWEGDTSGRTPEDTGAKTVRDGYCGLAGKP